MKGDPSPRTLDSLALAYFLSGDPAKAASVQRQALDALGEPDPELRSQLEEKLAKYVLAAREAGLDVEDDFSA